MPPLIRITLACGTILVILSLLKLKILRSCGSPFSFKCIPSLCSITLFPTLSFINVLIAHLFSVRENLPVSLFLSYLVFVQVLVISVRHGVGMQQRFQSCAGLSQTLQQTLLHTQILCPSGMSFKCFLISIIAVLYPTVGLSLR